MSKQLFAIERQKQLYTNDEIAYLERSKSAQKYISRKAIASEGTAKHYKTQVAAFASFVFHTRNKKELDAFVDEIKTGKHNPYDVLADFAAYLKKERTGDKKIKANTLSKMVRVCKRFLKFSGCAINNEDFKEQVSLPRTEVIEKKLPTRKA